MCHIIELKMAWELGRLKRTFNYNLMLFVQSSSFAIGRGVPHPALQQEGLKKQSILTELPI